MATTQRVADNSIEIQKVGYAHSLLGGTIGLPCQHKYEQVDQASDVLACLHASRKAKHSETVRLLLLKYATYLS